MVVEALTDNRNRTAANIRHIFRYSNKWIKGSTSKSLILSHDQSPIPTMTMLFVVQQVWWCIRYIRIGDVDV